MNEREWLAEQFEAERSQLRAVAYRMLGSLAEAEDAVQEAWLHINRSGTDDVKNVGGWLTTVVSRICLDMLRSRKSRREESLEAAGTDLALDRGRTVDPEQEAVLADSVGLALVVVLEKLEPAERIAFVLHDLFAVPFDVIAPIVGRSQVATRQLASRARRRVHGTGRDEDADLVRKRGVVDAFLAAARGGNFEALLTMLDPDVVARADNAVRLASPTGEVHGATAIARLLAGRALAARTGLINGAVGVIVAPRGRLLLVLNLTFKDDKIVEINAVFKRENLQQLDLAVFDN
jgi:RNA polymerase sigma factor (sigma-70 family)